MNSGVGFRQFMDIAVVIQQVPSLDWDWIYHTLDTLGLEKTAKVCFSLIAVWFDIHAPKTTSLSEIQIKEATEKVLTNGVFGFHDKENQNNALFNAIYKSKYPHLKMIQRAIQTFFPSYECMRHVPHYDFVNGRQWLLPAAWIYRALWGIRHYGIQRLKVLLKSSFISQQIIKEKIHILENFGMEEDKQ